MRPEVIYPHQLVEAHIRTVMGARMRLFDSLTNENMFTSMLMGLVDQLSIYCDVMHAAEVKTRYVWFKTGMQRCFLMVELVDRGAPLRLRDATDRWSFDIGNTERDFVAVNNARRWRFVEEYLTKLIEPTFSRIGDYLLAHQARKYDTRVGYRKVELGLVRYLEGVDATIWCAEIDPLPEVPGVPDSRSRYLVQ